MDIFGFFLCSLKTKIYTKMVNLQWIDFQITNLQTNETDTHTAPRQRRQNLIGSEQSV